MACKCEVVASSYDVLGDKAFFKESTSKLIGKKILKYAVELALQECSDKNVSIQEFIHIDGKSYYRAIHELNFDIHFMQQRRSLENGLSDGKLAGSLYFRLTRIRFIHINKSFVGEGNFSFLQERIMLKVVEAILAINLSHPWMIELQKNHTRESGFRYDYQNLSTEVVYFSGLRHHNQESLALFFDTMVYLQKAIDNMEAMANSMIVQNLEIPEDCKLLLK